MISIVDAYMKVFTELYPGQYSPDCIEDDTHYIFTPRPRNVPPDEKYLTGTIFPAVDKVTGEISDFNIATDELEHPKRHPLKFEK